VGITAVLDGRLAPTVVTAPRIRVRVQVFGIFRPVVIEEVVGAMVGSGAARRRAGGGRG
jgi:hypothetical protein